MLRVLEETFRREGRCRLIVSAGHSFDAALGERK
jgi:hypothetical protein